MNARVPWTATAGAAFGADWLLEAIAPASGFGRRVRGLERWFRPGDEAAARTALSRVAALARDVSPARLDAVRGELAAAPDPGAALARASSGATLTDPDFFELSRFLDAYAESGRLVPGVGRRHDQPEPSLEALTAALGLGRTPARSFYLDDAYAPALALARSDCAARQAAYDAARSRLAERAAAYAGVERLREGEFVVMRERLTAPVPPEVRVVREAPTYALCELALDERALAALAARDAALEAVATAEEAVRARLSEHVARAVPALEGACVELGELDVLVSRARFAQRYDCVVPDVVDEGAIGFESGRYLPLAQALKARGRRYAPLSLELEGLGVVTGPNMGGKSAALRTLGFMVACVALGVPVPALRARVPLVDNIVWLGLAGAAEDDGLLSAFGREVVALRALLQAEAGRTLVLVDEFARTTSPREGRALLLALLERLRERGAFGLAATHLTGIAAAANVAHYASGGLGPLLLDSVAPAGLEQALGRIADAMDFALKRVPEDAVGASDAIALAEALGIDRAFVGRARAAL